MVRHQTETSMSISSKSTIVEELQLCLQQDFTTTADSMT